MADVRIYIPADSCVVWLCGSHLIVVWGRDTRVCDHLQYVTIYWGTHMSERSFFLFLQFAALSPQSLVNFFLVYPPHEQSRLAAISTVSR